MFTRRKERKVHKLNRKIAGLEAKIYSWVNLSTVAYGGLHTSQWEWIARWRAKVARLKTDRDRLRASMETTAMTTKVLIPNEVVLVYRGADIHRVLRRQKTGLHWWVSYFPGSQRLDNAEPTIRDIVRILEIEELSSQAET